MGFLEKSNFGKKVICTTLPLEESPCILLPVLLFFYATQSVWVRQSGSEILSRQR